MAEPQPQDMLAAAAAAVRDPISGKSAADAGMIDNARVDDQGRLRFDLVFDKAHDRETRQGIEAALIERLRHAGFQGEVFPFARLAGSRGEKPQGPAHGQAPRPVKEKPEPVPGMRQRGGVAPHGGPIVKAKIPGVKRIICVASGKGGVGKSTVSTNLAIALQRQGHTVGLLDADVYGPSLPTMMNVHARPMSTDDQRIVPVNSYGVKCLSVGLLVPPEQAIIWRGPMVMGLVRQFLQQAAWGELDFLIIDLPPGTGDAQLTIIQAVDITGAVIVTTPQPVALADAVRGISMFRKLDVPLLGLVENMAWYELPDGTRDYVFGEGGGIDLAKTENTQVLGRIPLQSRLRKSGDDGLPAALADDALGQAFADIARGVVASVEPVNA